MSEIIQLNLREIPPKPVNCKIRGLAINPPFRKSKDTRNEREIQIPFISNISGYIGQKKLEVQQLDINNRKLEI